MKRRRANRTMVGKVHGVMHLHMEKAAKVEIWACMAEAGHTGRPAVSGGHPHTPTGHPHGLHRRRAAARARVKHLGLAKVREARQMARTTTPRAERRKARAVVGSRESRELGVAIDGAARATAGPMVQAGRQGSSTRPMERPKTTRGMVDNKVQGSGRTRHGRQARGIQKGTRGQRATEAPPKGRR